MIGTTGSPGNLAVKNKDQRKKTSKKILADHDEYYDRNKARWCEIKWPRGCFRLKGQKSINKEMEFKLTPQWQKVTCQEHI